MRREHEQAKKPPVVQYIEAPSDACGWGRKRDGTKGVMLVGTER